MGLKGLGVIVFIGFMGFIRFIGFVGFRVFRLRVLGSVSSGLFQPSTEHLLLLLS